MKIREAMENDLPAIVDIYNESRASGVASTNTSPVTVTRSKGWFRQHASTGRPIWVAEEAGRVIGWLSIRPFYRRPAYDATAKVLVYVAPGARGQGVGTRLLGNALSYGREAGMNAMVCYLLSGNEPARKLFAGSGFERWGHFPGVARVGDRVLDLDVMGRHL